MGEIDNLRKENDKEHDSLSDRIKSIGLVNKALMIILVAIFGVMLTLLLSINHYSEQAYNVRVKTFDSIESLKGITTQNMDWIKHIYKYEIHTNTIRSKSNSSRIGIVEKKVGIR